ncbi:MerR family transcriptional regulator [Haliangium ochraceum]|uniref:Transcriptional regulator, MerR family n=1 Tax=Haliangium ochraceum (strain DSM 14365 / JCM 11303 / SMP-2) TaxID=502025 RepID=D0LY91_HALO1|nr:MerR family transcriptional regulator [Haliangium ochraceum]ACY16241.1 transcriptional regulator, MerR family [Haliangium ochraceum DSM 14365]
MADDPRIPDKQFFRIGEVARLAGVKPHVLRFWETQFRSLKPEKSKSNHRVYGRADVGLVLRIRDLLYDEGFTIAGARRQLGEEVVSEIPAHTREVLQSVRNEVQELLRLVRE